MNECKWISTIVGTWDFHLQSSSEILVPTFKTLQHQKPEGHNLNNHYGAHVKTCTAHLLDVHLFFIVVFSGRVKPTPSSQRRLECGTNATTSGRTFIFTVLVWLVPHLLLLPTNRNIWGIVFSGTKLQMK